MARPKKKDPEDTGGGEVKDFDLAKKLYHQDIKPARSSAAEFMQECSEAFKQIKKTANIQPSAMKAAIKLFEMEDAMREDWLRCFNGLLRAENIDPDPKDMVDLMQAEGEEPARRKPQLVTVPKPAHPADDSDLADPSGEEPTSGTGAAAMAAMRAAAAAEGEDEPGDDDGNDDDAADGDDEDEDDTHDDDDDDDGDDEDDDFEASDEELAQQEGRGSPAPAA